MPAAALDQDADVVGAVGGGEVPVLLALRVDGVGRADDIELVVIDQRTAGLGRDVGELDELLLLGLVVGDAEDGGGDLVAQIDLEALVLVGGRVEVAVADDVLLDAGLQLAAALDRVDLGGAGIVLIGTGAAASERAGAGDTEGGQAKGLDELATRHIHCGTPSIGTVRLQAGAPVPGETKRGR